MSDEKGFDYPIAFLNEMDINKKNLILKNFIDMCFDDIIDVANIPIERLRHNFYDLLKEGEEAAAISEGKLALVMDGARSERRKKKTVAERAKKAGLVVLTPNVPQAKKLIIE